MADRKVPFYKGEIAFSIAKLISKYIDILCVENEFFVTRKSRP